MVQKYNKDGHFFIGGVSISIPYPLEPIWAKASKKPKKKKCEESAQGR
jgi:hypothetical protein